MEIFRVGISPHIHGEDSTRSIMLDVCIALVPTLTWGIYLFGARALVITLISILSSILFDGLSAKLFKRSATLYDLSAVVSGLIFAMLLPVSIPLPLIVLGTFFAQVIVKGLFGGIGKNFLNPALCAKAFLFLSFPRHFQTFTAPFSKLPAFSLSLSKKILEENKGTPPLSSLKSGTLPTESITDLFYGNTAGNLGQVSALLIFAGLLYLLVRDVVTWHIPAFYLGSSAILFFLFPMTNSNLEGLLPTLLAGALPLGIVFLSTDPVTTPVTTKGKCIFGILCGIFTFLFRRFTGIYIDVCFAILAANLFVWYLDRLFIPRPYGYPGLLKKILARKDGKA